MDKEKKDEEHRRYLRAIGLPFLLIVAPACGYFFGHWLDMKFNTKPYLSYLFLGLGIMACIRELYKIFTTFGKDDSS